MIVDRIAQMLRISLGGKIVVAAIQGTLGGLMFGWQGFPRRFLGFTDGGPFHISGPGRVCRVVSGRNHVCVAGRLAQCADSHRLGSLLIIHPVHNVLGPMLVGGALRIHTLLMFFSIVGGLAAFGASGVVLGPVTVAVAVALTELAERSR